MGQFQDDLATVLAALKKAGRGVNQYAQDAYADPANQIGFAGPVGNRFIRDNVIGMGQQLVNDWGGVKPAMRAADSAQTLINILTGKEKSVPFAPAYAGQKATDTATNAGQAAMDVATWAPMVGPAAKAGGRIAKNAAKDVADAVTNGGYSSRPLAGGGDLQIRNPGPLQPKEVYFTGPPIPDGGASVSQTKAVLTDVLDALKADAAERTPVNGYKFAPSSDSRARIFERGIKKELPDWKIQKNRDGEFFLRPGNGSPDQATQLSMGFGSGGKDGQRSLVQILSDAMKGKKASPLDQFTPPTSLDDIFTGGTPRGPREITGGSQNPAGLEGSFMNDPRLGNGPQEPVPYTEGHGFQGLDAKLGKQKPPGYDDWSPEWRAAYDKGLDMSPEAIRMRAAEQGFEGPFYHGMPRPMSGDNFRTASPREKGFFASSDPQTADHYAADGGNLINGGPDFAYNEGAAVYPVMIRNGQKFGGPEAEIMARDPANIRSTSAAFDPANAGKSTLLGAGLPAMDSELLKLLAAYGAFGGMSAGALATMDAQKKAAAANHSGF